MATFAELKTRVSRRIIDLPPAVTAEVGDLVNDAIRSMQRRYNWRAMEATQNWTTSEGVTALGTIDRFKEYRDKGPFLLRAQSKSRKILTVLDTDVNMAVLNTADFPDAPEFIMNSVNASTGVVSFSIAPFPDINSDWLDGDYRIVVPFYQYSAKLVNDGDTNWFTDNAEDYIVSRATARGFQLDWDYDSMALWLQDAEQLFNEIKQTDKKQRLASVDTLVPMWQGANQPQVRR